MRYARFHPYVTVGDIAHDMQISYPSATNMVNRLARKGLVKKEDDLKDRRSVRVFLTEKGEAIVTAVDEERASRFSKVLEMMDAEKKDQLLNGLHSFVQTALDASVSTPDEICLRCGFK